MLEIELSAIYLEICLLPSVETRQSREIIQIYYSFQNVPLYLPEHTGLSSSYCPPIQLSTPSCPTPQGCIPVVLPSRSVSTLPPVSPVFKSVAAY